MTAFARHHDHLRGSLDGGRASTALYVRTSGGTFCGPQTPLYRFDCSYEGCDFAHCDFEDVVCIGTTFEDCVFLSCSFTRCRFVSCTFRNCTFTAYDDGAEDCRFTDCVLVNCTQDGCTGAPASISAP